MVGNGRMGGLGARITQGKLKLKCKGHPVVGPFFQVGNSYHETASVPRQNHRVALLSLSLPPSVISELP